MYGDSIENNGIIGGLNMSPKTDNLKEIK